MSIDASAVQYAQKLLHKGYGFQNASRIAGLNEADLRLLTGHVRVRESKAVPRAPEKPSGVAAPVAPVAACCDRTRAVIERVAERYGLTRQDLTGPSLSRRRATMPRQEAYAAVRVERPHLSLMQIGRVFGDRDHTTILHGIRIHEARMAWAEFLIAAGRMDGQLDLFTSQAMRAAA